MKKNTEKLINYINSLSMRKDIKEKLLSMVLDIKEPDVQKTATLNPSPTPPPLPPRPTE